MNPKPASRAERPLPTQRDVAVSRVRFLTAETSEPPSVRGPILASWKRSHDLQVAADKIEMEYVPDVHLDTGLSRSAEPVLRSLREQLEGQSVSVILTDPSGLVLSRLTGDGDLERHLDRVLLAPGFSYAERFVGTNGIGTALEMGGPAHVFGHEHYAENLEDLACAGVPIHHPISGRLAGAVDLTCWRKDAGALLLTLAKATAEQIRQALLADAGSRQLGLFQEYLRTCGRSSGVVFAMNSDVVMLNDYARTVLSPDDQAILLAHAAEAMPGHQGPLLVELPSGSTARVHVRSVGTGDRSAGIVAHVRIDPGAGGSQPTRAREAKPRMPLPGLVGAGPSWTHACEDLERIFQSGEWLAVAGEAGVGKLALLRAVQLRRQPVGRFLVLDAADAASSPEWLSTVAEALTDDADSVVVRHVDRLGGAGLRGLGSLLQEAHAATREKPLWVAVTLGDRQPGEDLQRLLAQFPSTLEVPPLRLHQEDLNVLVPLFLSRLGQGRHLVCSPESMRLLTRMSWPGNIEQVHQTLRKVVKHRRAGTIQASDLPPEVHAVSRRMLSPLESMERDAIVTCLTDAGGNKVQAAKSLGMSRATIYRKIHEYGIVTPTD
jgi:transcriptional regulator of acetoin/glycerol metabolism